MHDKNCAHCNACCKGDYYDDFLRIYENLTPEQKKEIWRSRVKGVCCMLMDNLCEIEVRFGHEAKPDVCKWYNCKGEKK